MDPYILNREADMLEWKRLLVNGEHWNGMKKLKKPNRSCKNGHIGLVLYIIYLDLIIEIFPGVVMDSTSIFTNLTQLAGTRAVAFSVQTV